MRIEPLLEGDEATVAFLKRGLGSLLPNGQLHDLPKLQWEVPATVPGRLPIRLLLKSRENAFKFFFEMISNWLVPGERLPVSYFFAADFRLPDRFEDVFSLLETVVQVPSAEALARIVRNLPVIESDICLGVESAYHASRILECKGLSSDTKMAQVHERIAWIVKRRPGWFGRDLVDEAQSFLMGCCGGFKRVHSAREITRLICLHYAFGRWLRTQAELQPGARHVRVKVGRRKKRIALTVGVSLEGDHEVFGKSHLLKAVGGCLPGASAARDTFCQRQGKGLRLFYVELNRLGGSAFVGEEIERLQQHLPEEIRGRIQQQMHPLFLPRNDEEVMRHIVTVSSQLRYVRDLPQVILTFDQQSESELSFICVIARIMDKDAVPVQDLFAPSASPFRWVIERTKLVGKIRGRYDKEAAVLRVFVGKSAFLRDDSSLDVYRARGVVSDELDRIIGEFRDYFGGMISAQREVLYELKRRAGRASTERQLILEQLFHNFTPSVLRAVLGAEGLSRLYRVALEACEGDGWAVDEGIEGLYIVLSLGRDGCAELLRQIHSLGFAPSDFGLAEVKVGSANYLAMVLREDEGKGRRRLQQCVREIYESQGDCRSVLIGG